MGSQGPCVTWGWEAAADQGSLGLETVATGDARNNVSLRSWSSCCCGAADRAASAPATLVSPLLCLELRAGEGNLPLPLLPDSPRHCPRVMQTDPLLGLHAL